MDHNTSTQTQRVPARFASQGQSRRKHGATQENAKVRRPLASLISARTVRLPHEKTLHQDTSHASCCRMHATSRALQPTQHAPSHANGAQRAAHAEEDEEPGPRRRDRGAAARRKVRCYSP